MVRAGEAALAVLAGFHPEKGDLVGGFERGVGKGRIFLEVGEFGERDDGQLLGLVVLLLVLLVELRLEVADLQLRALVAKRKAFHPLFQNYIILPSLQVLAGSDQPTTLWPSRSTPSTVPPQHPQPAHPLFFQAFCWHYNPSPKKLENYNKNIYEEITTKNGLFFQPTCIISLSKRGSLVWHSHI